MTPCFTFGSFQELQECFKSRDGVRLQDVLANMTAEEAAEHLHLSVKSGLLVPSTKDAQGDGEEETENEEEIGREHMGK